MKKIYTFLFICFSCFTIVRGQTNSLEKYFLPQLVNFSEQQALVLSITSQNKDFLPPLLKFSDCVLFDVASQPCFDTLGNFSLWGNQTFPPSLRFQTDSLKNNYDQLTGTLTFFPLTKIENYTKPFYFRKYEVTNAEYWEFVNYVRDSVARELLASNGFADEVFTDFDMKTASSRNDQVDPYHQNLKEKIHWDATAPDYRTALSEMFVDPWINYAQSSTENAEHPPKNKINTLKLNHTYVYDSAGVPIPIPRDGAYGQNKNIVNVYPDTLSWIHDSNFPGAEQMKNNYFWHPAFANFPVVGVTYNQARAFLNWKTIEEQKKLDAKGIKLKVEFDLPNEIEWEMAATSRMIKGKINSYPENFQLLTDNSWLTDLVLDYSTEQTIELADTSRHKYFNTTNPSDSYLFTAPANLQKIKLKSSYALDGENITHDNSEILKQLDSCGISFMGGNVSEWLHQDYVNWRSAFLMQLKRLHSINTDETNREYERELYFDAFNSKTLPLKVPINYFYLRKPKTNKLVRGANWFDERYSNVFGKNPEGMNAKCFLDPDADYCTLGFRYVIRVTKK